MQFTDLLRATVLIAASLATGLIVISMLLINQDANTTLAAMALGWWAIAIAIGVYLGRAERARSALADPLAKAKTTTSLPSESPASIAFARLWPVGLFTIVVGAAGAFAPQVPAIAAGATLMVAAAWRNREAAVEAIEERDGVCFYVEPGNAFEPIKLVRTPGLKRGGAAT